MRKLTVGSLFAGIGGFDLGLERAGFEIKWQVEIDPFCRAVLEKHWPQVRRYEDVREVHARWDRQYPCEHCIEPVDVLCGGFPCQDISLAGKGAGLAGERSGLWSEYARLIRELRPSYVIVENVAALLARGMDTVCGDLARIGYDALWSVVSACAVGAPHVRRRLFLVAYPNGLDVSPRLRNLLAAGLRPLQEIDGLEDSRARYRERLANPSALYRDADGVPNGMERNRAIGNSVHPDIAEWIGRRILEAEEAVTR